MFLKSHNKNHEKTSSKIIGSIVSANDHRVVIKFSEDAMQYRKGKHISVGIPRERESALGKTLKIVDIVAYGKIINTENNAVTIQSHRAHPLISKSALDENKGKECMMFVQRLD